MLKQFPHSTTNRSISTISSKCIGNTKYLKFQARKPIKKDLAQSLVDMVLLKKGSFSNHPQSSLEHSKDEPTL